MVSMTTGPGDDDNQMKMGEVLNDTGYYHVGKSNMSPIYFGCSAT